MVKILESRLSSQSIAIFLIPAAAAKSLQSCPTLCDPRDNSPPGSPIPGILQARTLEWVAISFSNAWKWKVKMKSLSRVQLLATPWTAAYQAPPSMGFSRQEYWSGVPLPSPFLIPDSIISHLYTSQVALGVMNPPANRGDVRDAGLIPGSERSPGEGHGNPPQYSCLENPMDRRAWQSTLHRVTKSQIRLEWLSLHAHSPIQMQ